MRLQPSIYDSTRLAACYAFHRPPVHAPIIQAIGRHLRLRERVGRALDVGCGAGLSAAALAPLARTVVGLEPARKMLAHCRVVAPRAQFLVGQAEGLPFAAAAFDLITAAGSLDAASGNRFLAQAARVLAPGGVLIVYDFSAGRRFRENSRLQDWFAVFERRFPSPLGRPLAVRSLAFHDAGLRLAGQEALAVEIPMGRDAYRDYIMGQTGVEAALARGIPEAEIREWCQSTLAGVFGGEARTVIFDATIAYMVHAGNRP